MLAFGSGAAVDISDLHHCGALQRMRDHALAEIDLEGIVLARRRALESRFGNASRQRIVELLALQQRLSFAGTPWHSRDAAERHTRVTHIAILDIECDRRRCERELIGLAVSGLEIDRARPAA